MWMSKLRPLSLLHTTRLRLLHPAVHHEQSSALSVLRRPRPRPRPPPPSVLDVCEGDSPAEVVLLDAGVAPLCRRGVPGVGARPRYVHADHVPEVALQGPPVVVGRGGRRRVGHWLRLHHGHGDWAGLLGTAAVGHGAVETGTRTGSQ